jgi:hypothetical protein
MRGRILHTEDGLVVAEIGLLCTAVWRKDSTFARVRKQRSALAEVVASAPGKAGFFCVIEETSAPPNEAARKASTKMVEDHGRNLRAVACVIEGSGFRSSIVRSVASGIVMLARSKSKTPVQYFATVNEGATWIGQLVDIGSVDTFAKEVEVVRAVLNKYP